MTGTRDLEHAKQASSRVLPATARSAVLLLLLVPLELNETVELLGDLRAHGWSASTSQKRQVLVRGRTSSSFSLRSCKARCFATTGFSRAKRTISSRSRLWDNRVSRSRGNCKRRVSGGAVDFQRSGVEIPDRRTRRGARSGPCAEREQCDSMKGVKRTAHIDELHRRA